MSADSLLCHFGLDGSHQEQLLPLSEFIAGFLASVFRFLYCGMCNASFGHVVIFNARRMTDCSTCTCCRCFGIVPDMLKTYRKLVAASKNVIWPLPLPYSTQ
jgi:hypothetical protein